MPLKKIRICIVLYFNSSKSSNSNKSSPATDAGVRDVPHASFDVTVIQKDTISDMWKVNKKTLIILNNYTFINSISI